MGSHPCAMPYASLAVSGSKPAIWWTTNPRAVASSESCRLAAPTSYCAFRFGALFLANASSATAITSTGAFFAQFALNSTSAPSDFSKFSVSSFVATMYAHGCSLLLDGAQRAASNKLRSTSCGTGFSLNARGLQRFWINSFTGNSTGAGLLIFPYSPNGKQAALLRSLFHHLQVDRDRHRVAHHHAAAVHVLIPLHAKVLPVHFRRCRGGRARHLPGIDHRSGRAFHLQHGFFRHAVNRKIARDFQLARPVGFHFLRFKRQRRKFFDIEKVRALQ